MNHFEYLIFIIFFISKSSATALPWQLGCFDNDIFMLETIIKTISESELSFRCQCNSKSITNEKFRNVVVVNYKNIFHILKLNLKNNVVQREIIDNNESTNNLACKISKSISEIYFEKKISLFFCFIDKNEDKKLISEVKKACKDFLGVTFYNKVCSDYKKKFPTTINLNESKHCECFQKHLFRDVLPNLLSQMTNESRIRPRSLRSFLNNVILKSKKSDLKSPRNEAIVFFEDFNSKFADTKFFWNLLKHLLKDKEFGPYFTFFLDTSLSKENLTINNSVEQMCKNIITGDYCDLKRNDKNEWKQFVCNSLYELIFEVSNPKKHELIEQIISHDLKFDKLQLISIIKAGIRKKFYFYLRILQMILDDKSEESIKKEFQLSRMVFNKEYHHDFIEAVKSIFLVRSDKLSFKIVLDLN